MNPNGKPQDQLTADATATVPDSLAKEKPKRSAREDNLAFLNSLPEVKKPKPKHSILDEHLAFLNNLPKAHTQNAKVEPVVYEQHKESPAPTPNKSVKKKMQTQALCEEQDRIECEKAETKKLEQQQRQQEAEEREKRIALEEEQPLANQRSFLNSKSNSNTEPKIEPLLSKLLNA